MKTTLHNVKWILFYICVIGLLLLILLPNRHTEVIQGEVIIDSIHIYDTVPIVRDSIVYKVEDIDTAAVLQSYFTEYSYRDTIWTVDSLAKVFIEEKTFMNKLIDRDIVIRVKSPVLPDVKRREAGFILINQGVLGKYEKKYGRFSLGVVGGFHKKSPVVGFSVSYQW